MPLLCYRWQVLYTLALHQLSRSCHLWCCLLGRPLPLFPLLDDLHIQSGKGSSNAIHLFSQYPFPVCIICTWEGPQSCLWFCKGYFPSNHLFSVFLWSPFYEPGLGSQVPKLSSLLSYQTVFCTYLSPCHWFPLPFCTPIEVYFTTCLHIYG